MRKISLKCLKCSKLEFPRVRETNIRYKEKPKCWNKNKCFRKRSYYRNLESYRQKARENHRYLKFKGDRCCMCLALNDLEVHHIIPQSRGGEDSWDNTITLCKICHKFVSSYYKAVGWVG